MKKSRLTMDSAVFLLVIALLLGTIFTFGMPYWNKSIDREDCTVVNTRFVSHDTTWQRLHHIKEIFVNCANGNRYVIDSASANTELDSALSQLATQEPITLLIHPNDSTIMEFATSREIMLSFDKASFHLNIETTGFQYLGIFMYFCGLVGLSYIGLHHIRKRKKNNA